MTTKERMAADPAYKEKRRQSARRAQQKVRKAALDAYGGKCFCCGEDRNEFLAIDHIDGGGTKHRTEIFGYNSGGSPMYYWLRRENYPAGFQVACHNCNQARSWYGACPHEKEQK